MSDVKALEARVATLEAVVATLIGGASQAAVLLRGGAAPAAPVASSRPKPTPPPARGSSDPALRAGGIATDRDLDSQYGDPKVFRDPYGWRGQSYVGVAFSDCPVEHFQ